MLSRQEMGEWVHRFLLGVRPFYLILAVGCLVRGVGYLDHRPTNGHPVETYLPLEAWACVWVAVGIVCAVAVWRPYGLVANVAIIGTVGLGLMWSLSLLASPLLPEGGQSVGAAGPYIAVTGLVAYSTGRYKSLNPREVDDE